MSPGTSYREIKEIQIIRWITTEENYFENLPILFVTRMFIQQSTVYFISLELKREETKRIKVSTFKISSCKDLRVYFSK